MNNIPSDTNKQIAHKFKIFIEENNECAKRDCTDRLDEKTGAQPKTRQPLAEVVSKQPRKHKHSNAQQTQTQTQQRATHTKAAPTDSQKKSAMTATKSAQKSAVHPTKSAQKSAATSAMSAQNSAADATKSTPNSAATSAESAPKDATNYTDRLDEKTGALAMPSPIRPKKRQPLAEVVSKQPPDPLQTQTQKSATYTKAAPTGSHKTQPLTFQTQKKSAATTTKSKAKIVAHATKSEKKSAATSTKSAPKSVADATNSAPKGAVHATNSAPKGAVHATNSAPKSVADATKSAPKSLVDATKSALKSLVVATKRAQKSAVGATNIAPKGAVGTTKSAQKGAVGTTNSAPKSLVVATKRAQKSAVGATNIAPKGAVGTRKSAQKGAVGARKSEPKSLVVATKRAQKGVVGTTKSAQKGDVGARKSAQKSDVGTTKRAQKGDVGTTKRAQKSAVGATNSAPKSAASPTNSPTKSPQETAAKILQEKTRFKELITRKMVNKIQSTKRFKSPLETAAEFAEVDTILHSDAVSCKKKEDNLTQLRAMLHPSNPSNNKKITHAIKKKQQRAEPATKSPHKSAAPATKSPHNSSAHTKKRRMKTAANANKQQNSAAHGKKRKQKSDANAKEKQPSPLKPASKTGKRRAIIPRRGKFQGSYTKGSSKKPTAPRLKARPLAAIKTLSKNPSRPKKKIPKSSTKAKKAPAGHFAERVAAIFHDSDAVQLDVTSRKLSCADFLSELQELFDLIMRYIGPMAWKIKANRNANKVIAFLQVFGLTASERDEKQPFLPQIWVHFVLKFARHISGKFLTSGAEGDKACYPLHGKRIYKISFTPWLAEVRLSLIQDLHIKHPIYKALREMYPVDTEISLVDAGLYWFRPADTDGTAWSDFEPVSVKGVV